MSFRRALWSRLEILDAWLHDATLLDEALSRWYPAWRVRERVCLAIVTRLTR